LVDDDRSYVLEDTVRRGVGGHPHLIFETRLVQVPAMEMEAYRRTRNRVALSFLPNMRGDLDPVERILRVTMAFRQHSDSQGLRRFFALWVVEGRLRVEQQLDLYRRLKEMDMPEIIEWWLEEGHAKGRKEGRLEGMEEGLRASKLEDARKMREHGIAWEIVTDVTGLKPEDLA